MTENARAAIRASRHAVLSTIRDFSTLMVAGLLMIVSLWDVCIGTDRFHGHRPVFCFMTLVTSRDFVLGVGCGECGKRATMPSCPKKHPKTNIWVPEMALVFIIGR